MVNPVLIVALFATCWLILRLLDSVIRFDWTTCVVACLVYVISGFSRADELVAAACNFGIAGWYAYLAWKRRPPRKRREAKAPGRVKDLGHKLVVSS
ncbi:hypothetical protein JCM9957A_50400 [Kineosporia succinea]|uniref:Nicotinamide riboside transporter PnuC n=1 Tax=Kineosporia succinea TaxID=84632 RepID=A0ABT9P9K8_9ACTN|nr:hypothetical protein [Kineosporia succinea]